MAKRKRNRTGRRTKHPSKHMKHSHAPPKSDVGEKIAETNGTAAMAMAADGKNGGKISAVTLHAKYPIWISPSFFSSSAVLLTPVV